MFQVWYYVLADGDGRMHPDADLTEAHSVFPGLLRLSPRDQKRRLAGAIEEYRADHELLRDPRTEPHFVLDGI